MAHIVYVGVDPGATGSIAMIDGQEITFVDWSNVIQDIDAFFSYIARPTLEPTTKFIIGVEEQRPFGHEGRKSLWSFAMNYAAYIHLLNLYRLEYKLIPPKTWRNYFNLDKIRLTDTKKISYLKAKSLYPGIDVKTKSSGRADALLIAHYLMETTLKKDNDDAVAGPTTLH